MDIARRGVIEANDFIIVELSLKKPAQTLCPNPSAKITIVARNTESFSVTAIALFAWSGRSAPKLFDTLVLSQWILFVSICRTKGVKMWKLRE